ncbi:hypothetical protein GGR44_002047 [Sphingobium fontiphilum]|uniref:Uncharacterized protein n=1 Tax=Sphingobium fontiphilum TaxID=944425 RepID=A0A7W6GQT0_9SPHN|nr:hypothetical protein [Sphingobium fontiphilum]MBB3982384.1 hypothetical protein [Sphingobium fontiphilum]
MTSTNIVQFDIDDIADLAEGVNGTAGDDGLSISLMDVVIAIIVNR